MTDNVTPDIQSLEQTALQAKRRADQIEKEKIIKQHERQKIRLEREKKRKQELLAKLVAPLLLFLTVVICLLLYYL